MIPGTGEANMGPSGPAMPDQVDVPGDMQMAMQKIMSDPQALKEISGLGSKMAGLMAADGKMSPNTRKMMAQVMGGGGKRRPGPTMPGDAATPYAGVTADMMQFITPEMAKDVLGGVGIPTGRSRF